MYLELFSGVSIFLCYQHRLKTARPKKVACTNKIRKKVNIWAGISIEGPTEFAVNNEYFKQF